MFVWIVFLPLLGAIGAGLFGLARRPQLGAYTACAAVSLSAAMAILGFVQVAFGGLQLGIPLFDWIHVGSLVVDWRLRIDTLSAVMLLVVGVVSALVHIYSLGYMSQDIRKARFFAYLALFTFSMLALVTADNFGQLFFGWEAVGLSSYLLIGFWFHKDSANAAAIKAFIVNRVGDFGLLLGLALIYFSVGSLGFDAVFSAAESLARQQLTFGVWTWPMLNVICLLLFVGACGKSAQLVLHTWLPDAMEGPTPVSALIHAATMVTAGIFLLARCSPLFEYAPLASDVVVILGGLTALFAASVGLVQNDIKRVIAYSTCSQLGYMFVALGVGAYGVAMFHLFTHAFFKALLFLGAGSVIHATAEEQDIRKMGGLRTHLPFSWALMLVGTLALTGAPLTAGYYSKDAIIEASFVAGTIPSALAFVCLVLAALMTSFYAWRVLFLTFHGTTRLSDDELAQVHESPRVMLVPMGVLAVGALFAGVAFAPFFMGAAQADFWRMAIFTANDNQILDLLHNAPLWVVLAPLIMALVGFGLAVWFYLLRPDMPARLAHWLRPLYLFCYHKWYWDELYDRLLVRPTHWLARQLWQIGDIRIIDGLGPHGAQAGVLALMRRAVRLQTGYMYHYAFAMMLGLTALVSWLIVFGGGR